MGSDRRRLQPMTLGDVLDEIFYLFRNNFALLAGVAAVIFVPYGIVETIVSYRAPTRATLGSALMLVIQLVFLQNVIAGALSYAISQRYLDKEVSVGQAYRFIGRRIMPLLATLLLAGAVELTPLVLGVGIGAAVIGVGTEGPFGIQDIASTVIGAILFVAGIIFFVLFVVRLLVVLPVFVIEGVSGVKALRRSSELVSGFGRKVFGVILIAQFLAGLLAMAVAFPPQFLMQAAEIAGNKAAVRMFFALSEILTVVANVVLTPIVALAYALIYYDLRIRKEGFDIEILAQELESRGQNAEPALP